jgi:hypothetical protein
VVGEELLDLNEENDRKDRGRDESCTFPETMHIFLEAVLGTRQILRILATWHFVYKPSSNRYTNWEKQLLPAFLFPVCF